MALKRVCANCHRPASVLHYGVFLCARCEEGVQLAVAFMFYRDWLYHELLFGPNAPPVVSGRQAMRAMEARMN